MGRASDSIHVVTLLAIALLAWPWDLMLSVAEARESPPPARSEVFHAQGGPGARSVVRQGPRHAPGRAVIAPDFDCDDDELEAHSGSHLSPSSILSLTRVNLDPWVLASAIISPIPPLKIGLQKQHRRLRC